MPTTNYRKGYLFEKKVSKMVQLNLDAYRLKYNLVESRGSHGTADIMVGIGGTKPLWFGIQCRTSKPSIRKMGAMIKSANKKHGMRLFVAYKENGLVVTYPNIANFIVGYMEALDG